MKKFNLKISIPKKIVGMVLLIILFICTVMGYVCSQVLYTTITTEIEKQLSVSAYNFKTEYEIMSDEEMNREIHEFKSDNSIDVTIFEGDMRIISTIDDAVGTRMNSQILDDLSIGKSYFATNANVNGSAYFGYYVPIMTNEHYLGAVFTGIPQSDANTVIIQSVLIIIACILVCGLIAVILAVVITKKISKSISELQDKVIALTANDLSVDYDTYEFEHDEIEELCNKTANFAEHLKHVIIDIKSASFQLKSVATQLNDVSELTSNTSNEISKAVEEVANGAIQQAEDTQDATNKISEMSDELDHIHDNVTKLRDIASSMDNVKVLTLETLNDLQKVNGVMSDDIKSTSDQVNVTNESVYRIKEAINVIQNIASQTKLLSLNASIEAARAGDNGKGFAVVAENIRILANQSSESSDEINKILVDLLTNYELIITNVQNTTNNMFVQNSKLSETQEAFTTLESNINETLTRVNNITTMIENLNHEINDMVDVISNLSAISQENSASAEQTMASIQELNANIHQVYMTAQSVDSNADNLMNEVGVFKTK